jgi:hypothetical protein
MADWEQLSTQVPHKMHSLFSICSRCTMALTSRLMGQFLLHSLQSLQVVAIIMLASVVSLPIMVTVDLLMPDPESTYQFATTGVALNPFQPGERRILWLIQQSYFFIAMTWQGVVTLVGLTAVHRSRWYLQIPGILLGNAIFFGFMLVIKDYVALII